MSKSRLLTSSINPKLLVERYQLKQLIGRGGMGEVFLADDVLLGGIPVAIKFLSQIVSKPFLEDDFAREARICAALSQKSLHIVRVTDYGMSEQGKPFYVMEYLCGKSLKELIPVPLPMFLSLCRQICLGLQCAHQGMNINGKIYPLVHKDIKPANILVVPDPILGQLAKILDFGIAQFLDYSAAVDTNNGFNGTLPYCSPEQLEGDELDSRSDIYSLGVTMFEMLTGQKPWQPETELFGAWYRVHHFEAPFAFADVNPNLRLPKELDNLIMACLAKTASDRPQNLAEVLQVLESLNLEGVGGAQRSLSGGFRPSELLTRGDAKRERREFLSRGNLQLISRREENYALSPHMEQVSEKLLWPEDKPIREIVFPRLLNTKLGERAALWLMMSRKQIEGYTLSIRYNQFIFVTSPYPILLWVTLLYNRKLGPKWLPCYLDMQNPQNHRLVCSLAENQRYPLILFTLEAPHSCVNVISSRINPHQRQMLKAWVEQSNNLPPSNAFQLSKNLLKQQYKQMQSQILQRLVSTSTSLV